MHIYNIQDVGMTEVGRYWQYWERTDYNSESIQ